MSLLSQLKRLIFVDCLIRKKATGTPEKFAEKNRLSRSHLMNIIKDMKDLGYPIKYSRNFQTYYYDDDEKIPEISFSKIQLLSRAELSNIGQEANNLCFSDKNIFEKC
ncbi:hypothetical protein [Niabella drilacis]|uniref:HTH domain-containing protein n=1 Tax=Niabella drilacis (strain DSM 25811 / CCM 8410 / CCUG 62505 / LMG 26954 / E90) TaxID=1285928 RepID=A0A1G6VMX4_NIADE|nr:hypothetical protein [Niabella drilacis]SDD54196.1 hypothetical protein SAMN04487894_11062 [Niabella drilacis]